LLKKEYFQYHKLFIIIIIIIIIKFIIIIKPQANSHNSLCGSEISLRFALQGENDDHSTQSELNTLHQIKQKK